MLPGQKKKRRNSVSESRLFIMNYSTTVLLQRAVALHAFFNDLQTLLPEGFGADVNTETLGQVCCAGFTGAGQQVLVIRDVCSFSSGIQPYGAAGQTPDDRV
jgi:hypothetical protein